MAESVVAGLLAVRGVAVRLPEAGGPVSLADPNHRVLIDLLGAQSQREVVRSRHRTLAAMTAQTVEQGRFLGGRPPYGYRLVDAGPHPNRAHAGWGASAAAAGSGPGDRAACAVDLRRAACRSQRGSDRS
jgi:hypothetical protein